MKKQEDNLPEILQIKSDRVFHDLFNEYAMETLEWTVMQILQCKYEEIHGKVSVKNVRLTNVSKNEKTKYVDLLVEYQNQKILIELNNNFNGNYTRNFVFAMNNIANSFKVGEKDYYEKRVKVILINLNWYKNKEREYDKEVIEVPYPNEKVDDYILKIININLDYYDKICYNEVDFSDRVYKLFTIKNKQELKLLMQQEKMLFGYSKKLMNLSDDKKYREEIMDLELEEFFRNQDAFIDGKEEGMVIGKEEGIVIGKEEGIVIGKEEGMRLEKRNLVKKLLQKGMADEAILELVELDEKELSKIKKELEKEN